MIRTHVARLKPSRLRPLAILLGVSAAVIALPPGIARAHAIIVAAQPAMNSTVARGELEIRLDFNSQIDRKRSRLSLQRPDGSEIIIALAPDGPAGVLAGQAQATLSGSWKLRWQVLLRRKAQLGHRDARGVSAEPATGAGIDGNVLLQRRAHAS